MNVATRFTLVFIYFLNRISTRQARDSKRQHNQNVSFAIYKKESFESSLSRPNIDQTFSNPKSDYNLTRKLYSR